jgi:uncharacterized protein (DUF1778 family)
MKQPNHLYKSVVLRLNAQQRELLEKAVASEGLTSIADLVRLAISHADETQEKPHV